MWFKTTIQRSARLREQEQLNLFSGSNKGANQEPTTRSLINLSIFAGRTRSNDGIRNYFIRLYLYLWRYYWAFPLLSYRWWVRYYSGDLYWSLWSHFQYFLKQGSLFCFSASVAIFDVGVLCACLYYNYSYIYYSFFILLIKYLCAVVYNIITHGSLSRCTILSLKGYLTPCLWGVSLTSSLISEFNHFNLILKRYRYIRNRKQYINEWCNPNSRLQKWEMMGEFGSSCPETLSSGSEQEGRLLIKLIHLLAYCAALPLFCLKLIWLYIFIYAAIPVWGLYLLLTVIFRPAAVRCCLKENLQSVVLITLIIFCYSLFVAPFLSGIVTYVPLFVIIYGCKLAYSFLWSNPYSLIILTELPEVGRLEVLWAGRFLYLRWLVVAQPNGNCDIFGRLITAALGSSGSSPAMHKAVAAADVYRGIKSGTCLIESGHKHRCWQIRHGTRRPLGPGADYLQQYKRYLSITNLSKKGRLLPPADDSVMTPQLISSRDLQGYSIIKGEMYTPEGSRLEPITLMFTSSKQGQNMLLAEVQLTGRPIPQYIANMPEHYQFSPAMDLNVGGGQKLFTELSQSPVMADFLVIISAVLPAGIWTAPNTARLISELHAKNCLFGKPGSALGIDVINRELEPWREFFRVICLKRGIPPAELDKFVYKDIQTYLHSSASALGEVENQSFGGDGEAFPLLEWTHEAVDGLSSLTPQALEGAAKLFIL